ncbi:MAG: alpha/beta fold hydrolase [Alphaproteobacteria bacterium]|nr:alpha/beta fold hydrolase [Alphaproteobacteria bacterium]
MAEAVLDGLPPFRPRLPWWGPDLQTIRSVLIRSRALDGHAGERLYLPFADGSGDRLAAIVNRPAGATEKPLVVLVHGLTGLEDSFYMRESAAHFLACGFPVLRLNLRGAGRSRPLCSTQYHAGSSDDLAHVFASLPGGVTTGGVAAVGYSLGANLLLKYLGEHGTAAKLVAAAVVSAPLDLAGTARRLNRFRNTAYQRYLLRYMKAEAMAPGADLATGERRAIMDARSVWEFDDVYSAPRAGYGGAAEYYARTASGQFLGGVRIPTLIVYALDDPWIPPEPYRDFDWRGHPNLHAVLTRRGGHVGFHGDGGAAWHDLAIARFFDAVSPA